MNSVQDLTALPADAGERRQPAARRPWLRPIVFVEIAVFLGVALLVDHFVLQDDRLQHIHPHPFWALVLLLSVQYGTIAGLLAAVASSVALLFGNLPPQSLDQDIHQWLFAVFKLPLLWSVTAVVLGELSARYLADRYRLQRLLTDSREREAMLTDSFHHLNAIKEKLEVRVASQWRTVSRTWKAARAVERLEPNRVLNGALDLVENLLEPEKFSIYTFQDSRLELSDKRGWDDDDTYVRTYRAEDSLFVAIVGERRVLCVNDPEDELILESEGVLAGPLVVPSTGEFLGMVKIESLGFTQLSLSTIENFQFICEWIGSIYGNATQHRQGDESSLFLGEQQLYNEAFFDRHKAFLADLARRIGFDLAMIKVQLEDYDTLPREMRDRFATALGKAVKAVLRATDLAFQQRGETGEFAIFLPGAKKRYLGLVKGRLRQAMEQDLAAYGDDLKYDFEVEILAHRDVLAPVGEAGVPATAGGEADFRRNKRFLAELAGRLGFPVAMLYLKLAGEGGLDEVQVRRFDFILKRILTQLLGDADQALFHKIAEGEYYIALPGVDEDQAKRAVMTLDKALAKNRQVVPLRFGYSIQMLQGNESAA